MRGTASIFSFGTRRWSAHGFESSCRQPGYACPPHHPQAEGSVRMTAPWWQTGVIYQIYLRAFQDTDGDGIGDLKGVARRLDYLAGLGVEAIWISPFYPSPMADFGYDVADYCGVDARFGTLADFDDLLAQAH